MFIYYLLIVKIIINLSVLLFTKLVGKGSFWCIDSQLRPNLLQAVRRTSAHIYPHMSSTKANFITNSNPPRFSTDSASKKLQS